MKKVKRKILKPSNLDAIKAMRRGGREAEMELLGPGFHTRTRIHASHGDRHLGMGACFHGNFFAIFLMVS